MVGKKRGYEETLQQKYAQYVAWASSTFPSSLHAKENEPFLAESIYALSRLKPGTGSDNEMK